MVEPNQYPMTVEALEGLRQELERKQTVERTALAAKLKAAIELGDLSENADYHDAKERQGFLEGRINELKEMIAGAVIIEAVTGSDTVVLGSTVIVLEKGESITERFEIVGAVEANPREGKISNVSPLGKALLGGKVGDDVKIAAPDGDIIFTIKEIA